MRLECEQGNCLGGRSFYSVFACALFICDPRVCVYELLYVRIYTESERWRYKRGKRRAQRRVAFATQRHFIKRVGFRLMKIDRPWWYLNHVRAYPPLSLTLHTHTNSHRVERTQSSELLQCGCCWSNKTKLPAALPIYGEGDISSLAALRDAHRVRKANSAIS